MHLSVDGEGLTHFLAITFHGECEPFSIDCVPLHHGLTLMWLIPFISDGKDEAVHSPTSTRPSLRYKIEEA
jgi:hypothetical protein